MNPTDKVNPPETQLGQAKRLSDILISGNKTADLKRYQHSTDNDNDEDEESFETLDDLMDLFGQPLEGHDPSKSKSSARTDIDENLYSSTEPPNDASALDPPLFNTKATFVTTNPQETTPLNPYKNYKDSIHPSLKKPFRIPFRSSAASLATVVTPQTKANTSSIHTGKESSHPLNKIIYQETQQSKLIHSHDAETTEIPQEPLKNHSKDLYISPYIDESLKLNAKDVSLDPDLEQLRPLILSQHAVFYNLIKDMGDTGLTFTKLINKKKESLSQLKNNKTTPRSLRIKCELTASPPYTSHKKFQHLKEQLQDAVTEFISKGTTIMTEWSETNIHLLTVDRCSNILVNALTLLDGLASYHMDVIGNPGWSPASPASMNLLLLQLYLHSNFGNAEELLSYLELPSEDVLTLAAKIITNNNSDEAASSLIQDTAALEIQLNNAIQKEFVSETLTQFNQIMHASTTCVWKHYSKKMKQITAANNLKAKITALETIKATAATAAALTKATENLQEAETRNIQENLRLTNLEKSFKRQEQKTNEIANALNKNNKNTNKNNKQKNSYGSHLMELMASPNKKAPSRIVDLTSEEGTGSFDTDPSLLSPPYPTNAKKKQKWQHNAHPKESKSVQWQNGKINHYNPETPVANMLPPYQMTNQLSNMLNQPNPPYIFPPAPAPLPLFAPLANPFSNQQQNVYNSGSHNHFLQNQTPLRNPFLPQPSSNLNTNYHKRGSSRYPRKRPQH